MTRQSMFQAKKESQPLQTSSLFRRQAPVEEREAAALPINLGRDFSGIPFKPVHPAPALGPSSISCPFTPQRCPFGGACHACPPKMQAKLKIGQPGDQYEQEADRVAEQVMRMPEPQVQRKCSAQGCKDEDEKKLLQTKPANTGEVGAQVDHPLIQSVLASPGQPLDAGTRSFMEPRFGQDFSGVRVHTDGQAAESARSIGAHAYTLGKDIVFARDEYKPIMHFGCHLLAHELTHVVQQSKNSASSTHIQRAVRVNNGAQHVNEAEYQAGGAKSNVGARYRVWSLISDSIRRTFVDVAELERYANGQTDYIGDVTTSSAGVYWYRLPSNQVTVLGERHQNPRGNVEDIILGLNTSRFMYEPFNEITQVGALSPQFSSTQGRLSQTNRQYRVSSLVNRQRYNPELESIVIKAVTGAQIFRNEFLPANPQSMSATQRQVWGRRASTSDYSYGERVALYLTIGIHIAQDLVQRPAGPPIAAEQNFVQSGDTLATFYVAHQSVLDGIMQAKDRNDLIGIYELTAPNNFSVLQVLRDFSLLMHAYAANYIQRLGAETGNAALTSGGQALERNPGATLLSLSPVREEIMWNRLQQAISGGYLIVGMGDAHRNNLTLRLNTAGIPHEEVEASLRGQQTAVNNRWRP